MSLAFITRRDRPYWPVALVSLALLAAWPVAAASLPVTPADDFGPFYPLDWRGEIDSDLFLFGGASAAGERLRLHGVVREQSGRPVADVAVEIWQADASGRYRHPGVPESLRDRRFQGYGRSTTDAAGRYEFITVMPGRYGGRPPHIHFRLAQPGRAEFVTQMYFRGENRDYREGGNAGELPVGRERLSVELKPAGVAGGLSAHFDLVLP